MPNSNGRPVNPDAVLLCDKPPGITSHDLVAGVRKQIGGRRGRRGSGPKVGHAGTLDPFATGLLMVLVGRATRLQRYLLTPPKLYRAKARLGWRSSTGDRDGELTRTGRAPASPVLPEGTVMQRVPMTSAVKVGGERLYRKAHRGEQAETPVREVTVHRAELLAHDPEAGTAEFEISCSSGTYVRSLIETLEDAYCEELRRIAIGSHRVADGRQVEITPAEALDHLAARALSDREAGNVRNGGAVSLDGDEPDREAVSAPGPSAGTGRPAGAEPGSSPGAESCAPPGMEPGAAVRLIHGGELLAVARADGRALRPETVLV